MIKQKEEKKPQGLKVIGIILAVVIVGGCAAYAVYFYHNINVFESSYGIDPRTETDDQKAIVQEGVKRTIVVLEVHEDDARNAKCEKDIYINDPDASLFQDCIKQNLADLKAAESALKKATDIAIHYGYDANCCTWEDMAAYRKAHESQETSQQ